MGRVRIGVRSRTSVGINRIGDRISEAQNLYRSLFSQLCPEEWFVLHLPWVAVVE